MYQKGENRIEISRTKSRVIYSQNKNKNMIVYIKYEKLNAIGIDVSNGKEISTIQDLVNSYKQLCPKYLGSFELQELALHLPTKAPDGSPYSIHKTWFSDGSKSPNSNLTPSVTFGLSISALGSIGTDSRAPLVIRKYDQESDFDPVQSVLDDFFASKEFQNIKSSSEEDLTDKSLNIEQSSGITEELEEIRDSPLLDHRLEDVLGNINVTLPYRKLPHDSYKNRNITVLVGVSGCGKSRTCMDIAMSHDRSLYFEISMHEDIKSIIDMLDDSLLQNRELVKYSKNLFAAVFLARIAILETLSLTCRRKFLSYQKSKSFQTICLKLVQELLRKCEYFDIKQLMSQKMADYIVIIDESQQLIKKLENRYMSSKDKPERSLLRFLVDFVSINAKASFWCGTHLGLCDIDRFASAACGKESDIIIFTDFQCYTFNQIRYLLEIYLGADRYKTLIQDDHTTLLEACYLLQGRPRLVTSFCRLMKKKIATEKFADIFHIFIQFITESEATEKSFRYFWKRVINNESKMHNFSTGVPMKTPDFYLYTLLAKYLLRTPDNRACNIQLLDHEADLIGTGLVSLDRIEMSNITYTLVEPLVLEAAISLMKTDSKMASQFMHHCIEAILSKPDVYGLDACSRGKMIDRFIALRFRLGWWKYIPPDDKAWDEIPEVFVESFKTLEEPKYVALESSVNDGMLLHTFCNYKSHIYVLPAENSGPDGFYRYIAYLGKSSFTRHNQHGDIYVDSEARAKNLIYADINNWFKSLKTRAEILANYGESTKLNPILFICAEWPFYGPYGDEVPAPIKNGDNWVIHLDLRSRLACYLLGEEFVKAYKVLLSERQRTLIPIIQV